MDWKTLLDELFGEDHDVQRDGDLLRGTARIAGQPLTVVGTTDHAAIGVELALTQARVVLDTVRQHPGRSILMLVDTQGQRLRRRDEMLGINRYMAHLGLTVDRARRRGHRIVALVYDQALSGGFITSGLMAEPATRCPAPRSASCACPAMARVDEARRAEAGRVVEEQRCSHPVSTTTWRWAACGRCGAATCAPSWPRARARTGPRLPRRRRCRTRWPAPGCSGGRACRAGMKPLPRPHRNQLVRIDDRAWRELRDAGWDAEPRSLLAYWSEHRLPLVVARDRGDAAAGQLCVGLPAPLRWSRRRLALSVRWDCVQMTGAFPTLVQVARALRWGRAAIELAQSLSACEAVARVYGAHGWQVLSGETCLRPGSDIDLIVEVDDTDTAHAVLPVLQRARLHRCIDGEFVFPDGEALAWREFERAAAGKADRVLLKSRSGARLVGFDAWCGVAQNA